MSANKTKGAFDEKKEWPRDELARKIKNASPYIPGTGGKMYSLLQREKMIDDLFPQSRFKSHVSEEEVKIRLRELRREEYNSKDSSKKIKLARLRKYLERELDFKGKY